MIKLTHFKQITNRFTILLTLVTLATLFSLITNHKPVSATGSSSFAGNVSNSQSSAIPGLVAGLFDTSSLYTNSTDQSGNYAITTIPDGNYNISLSTDSSTYLPIAGGIGSDSKMLSGVTLKDSTININVINNVLGQNFVIPTSNITVTVDDSFGKPLPNTTVELANPRGNATVSLNGSPYIFNITGPGQTTLSRAPKTNSLGQVTVAVPQGTTFATNAICAIITSNFVCDTNTESINSTDLGITINAPASPQSYSGNVSSYNGSVSNSIPAIEVNLLVGTTQSVGSTTNLSGQYAMTANTGQYNIQLSTDVAYQTYSGNGGSAAILDRGITLTNTTPNILLINGNLSNQNFIIPTTTLLVTVLNSVGTPQKNIPVDLSNPTGNTSVSYNSNNYNFAISGHGDTNNNGNGTTSITDSNGQLLIAVPIGTIFNPNNICVYIPGGTDCNANNVTLTTSQSITISETSPSNLSGTLSGNTPVLNWNAFSGANSYKVYRNNVLVGTPITNSFTDNSAGFGNNSYFITAVSSNGESLASNTINLYINSPASITSSASLSTNMRQPFNFTVTTSGTPIVSTINESGVLPSGVTFTDNGNGTATISGIPAVGSAGTYNLAITANNGVGSPATQTFTLTVSNTTYIPTIISNNNYTATFGINFSFKIKTTGYPTPTFKITGALPSGVTFTDNGDGNATISGTPINSAKGIYYLTITATNANGNTTQAFTLTVDRAPVLSTSGIKTAYIGTAYTLNITTSKAYPKPVTIIESGNLPSGIVFKDNGNGTATISGIAAVGSAGKYSINITASNVTGSASKIFIITVK